MKEYVDQPSFGGAIADLAGRVGTQERTVPAAPITHRVTVTATSFPSPPWRPPAAVSLDEIWVDTDSAVAADTVFAVSRNGASIGTATVAAGKSRVAARLTTPVSVDVHDVVTVTAGDTGSVQATVQVLGTSGHPITPSLGGGGAIPAGRMRSTSTTTTVTSGAAALVQMDHTDFTVGGMTGDTGSSTRLVIPVNGIYQAAGQVVTEWAAADVTLSGLTADQQSSPSHLTFPVGFDTASTSTWWTSAVGGGAGSVTAAFDGFAVVSGTVTLDNEGGGYGNEVKVYLKAGGSEVAGTATTFDLDVGNHPIFTWSKDVIIPVSDAATNIEIWIDWIDGGDLTGHADPTEVGGSWLATLTATRVDAPGGVEAALIVRDSGNSVVDTVAVSDAATRTATLATAAFEAVAGDYVELWAYNPSTNADVVVVASSDEADTIHAWLPDNSFKAANTEFQVAWVGPGAGTRPGGGGT